MKQTIINFLKRAFAPNSIGHGALLAAIVVFGGIMQPILASNQLPTLAQLLFALKVTAIAFVSYLLKNGLFGTSEPTTLNNKSTN